MTSAWIPLLAVSSQLETPTMAGKSWHPCHETPHKGRKRAPFTLIRQWKETGGAGKEKQSLGRDSTLETQCSRKALTMQNYLDVLWPKNLTREILAHVQIVVNSIKLQLRNCMKKVTEASASVCLLLTTALKTQLWFNVLNLIYVAFSDALILSTLAVTNVNYTPLEDPYLILKRIVYFNI